MQRIFLDACVLFSAAYKIDSPLKRLWTHEGVTLISSAYACEEAHRNLSEIRPERIPDLDSLLAELELVDAPPCSIIPDGIMLPEKDQPILFASIEADADYLVTVDKRHFQNLFGKRVGKVEILSPADLFRIWAQIDL